LFTTHSSAPATISLVILGASNCAGASSVYEAETEISQLFFGCSLNILKAFGLRAHKLRKNG
jgi:hypothetical protein